ncbi:MAG: DUF58 domain-containing protein [Candidatus Krumholzibacteriota bacterium]|nr:DUF58 domain-containing protein [Candidatus Krumholzibacteriota bacterium]
MAERERIPPEILRKVRKVELSTRHLVEDLFGGEYHSVFKGTGMEFDEVREYTADDDVRFIDWNVTARMGRPFIKRFREERELTVLLAVDASASGLFGSGERLKSEFIAEVASVLAFSAIRNLDKVGCLIFTDRVEKYIPPDKGHRHVLRIIRELLYFRPEGSGTDLGLALETVSRLLRRKAVVFLVSDFLAEGWEMPLKLAARRHDLIALNVHDPLERRLPDAGLLHLRDAETGADLWLDAGSAALREAYADEAGRRKARLSELLLRHGVDEIDLDVTRDYARPLTQFFRKRMRRLSKGFRGAAVGLLLVALAALAGPAGAQQTPPPAMTPGAMMGQQGPSLPLISREDLEKMEQPDLALVTADARPRWLVAGEPGIEVESRLERDLQVIGQPNALTWRVILSPGAELAEARWDLGEPGRVQPWLDPERAEALAEELRQSAAGGAMPPLTSFIAADTLRGAGAPDTLRFTLPFTTFLPDTFAIPGQAFAYRLPGEDGTRVLVTEPQELACLSVLALTPDSTALRDWKAPGALRADWWPVLARWGLPALAALLAGALLLRWWLRRRRARLAAPEPPTPADVEALAALEGLALEDLPAQGLFADYYYRLSRIVRRYLSRRFALPFADWTSEEIRLSLAGPQPRLRLDQGLAEPLLEDLDRGDLVKFAQRVPSRADCVESLQASKRLVKATRPALVGEDEEAEP